MSKKRPNCPKCGGKAAETKTRFGLRYDCCGLWSWGRHPLADQRTHKARKAAHAAFDPIWKSGLISRGAAYQILASKMRISPQDCHMKKMDAETAEKVPALASVIRKEVAA